MGLTKRDCLYQSTTSKCWICLIEDRIMVGTGSRSRGKCSWVRKSDVAQVFKHSRYWKYIKLGLKAEHPELPEYSWYGAGSGQASRIMNDEYNRLLKEGVVKYIDLSMQPEWFKF